MQPSPRFRIYSRPSDYLAIAGDVLTGRVRRGDDDRSLEEAVATRVGAEHALCVAKARVGIHVAIRALIEPGQKVILSPYTISDVVNMVVCAGGIPVFADLERETCNVDPADVERLIDGDTGAVMVTHLHGLACDMDRITAACRAHGVPLLEDAAQAFGARFDGRHVGTFGEAGIYSFGMYKNVNAFFGGMVVTSNDTLAARLRSEIEAFPSQEVPYYLTKVASGVFSDVATWPPLFKSIVYRIFRWGYLNEIGFLNQQVTVDVDPQLKRSLPESYLRRMTPMQARIVAAQLGQVDERSRRRIENARVYHEGLADVKELLLPPLRDDLSHIYTYFPIQCDDRDGLLRHMMRERCDVAAQHLHNCADLECFSEFQRDCPNARACSRSVVLLPTYPRYTARDIERNVRVVREYLGA